MNLRWAYNTPDAARFDWGNKHTGRCWLYASRAGVSVAIAFRGADELTEINVSPIEVGPYAWEGRCKTLEAAKRKAVKLVQASIRRMAKGWEVRA